MTIPNSILRIGADAFYNCYSLASVTIPFSVTSIGKGAFNNCGLRSVVIPNSITAIEDDVFFDCYSLASVTIPVSVTSIGNYSFGDCYGLISITIPNSVTSIGKGAFYNCGLKSVVVPASISSIEDSSFQGCYALTSVTFPISVTSIGNYSFYNCYALKTVTIPGNVSRLGNFLFGNCYALTSATIAGSVTSIGANAFSNCYGLSKITFLGNAPAMGNGWKSGCSSNMTVYCYQGMIGFTSSSWYGVTLSIMTSLIAPQNLTATAGDGIVRLAWTAPINKVVGSTISYAVYQNGTDIKHLDGLVLVVTGLTNGKTYNFTVVNPRTMGNMQNFTSVAIKLPVVGMAVDGTATNESGGSIANATVTLSNNMTVTTNDFGMFVFYGVKAGNYSLSISKDGYSTLTQNITVKAGANTDLDAVVLTESGVDTGSAPSSGQYHALCDHRRSGGSGCGRLLSVPSQEEDKPKKEVGQGTKAIGMIHPIPFKMFRGRNDLSSGSDRS